MKMTVAITAMESPYSFTDEMITGPFKSMKHQHLFARENGQTIMKDIFQFESPFGFVGRSVNNLFLKNYMKNLLISRNKVIKSHIETAAQL